MTTLVVAIFCIVYLGMILGGLPYVALDRTGVALLGAIALLTIGDMTLEQAARAIHLPTILLLFAFMVISAQLRLGGFYGWVTRTLAASSLSPPKLLGALIFTAAGLAAVFSNDIVCFAVAPVLIDACRRRGVHPLPYLLALACAANIGSAATLIGNPQNILIGQKLQLSFVGYAAYAIAPVGAGLAACWLLIAWQSRRRWNSVTEVAAADPDEVALNPWQTTKGLAVVAAIMLAFVFTSWPREHVALAGAGILLTSRKLHSRRMLGLVDWELLILFIGLFVVNRALERTGILPHIVDDLATAGLSLDHTGGLFGATFVLSNIVSNVPAVMLLLPVAHHPDAGPVLALASTFSGNLFIVGSIANIIVIDAALRRGIRIDWHQHARTGVPVTLATLAICAAYLWLRGSA